MSRGYGFVHFLDVQDAQAALEALNGSTSDIGTSILVEKSVQGRRYSARSPVPSALGHRGYAFAPLTSMSGGDPWGSSHGYKARYDVHDYDRDAGRKSKVCLSSFESDTAFRRYGRPLVSAPHGWIGRPEVFDRFGRPLEYLPRYEGHRRRVVEEYVEEPIPRLSRGYSEAVFPRLVRREDSPPSRRRTRSPSFSTRNDRWDGEWDRNPRLL